MKIKLTVLSAGSAKGKSVPISSAPFVIGRDAQCKLRPASPMVSKRHCAVLVKAGRVFVQDFESTNGTLINNRRVKGMAALADGDILSVGPLMFKVVIDGLPSPGTRTPAQTADETAAAFLCVGDDTGTFHSANSDTGEHAIPDGETVDMPKPAAFATAPPDEPTRLVLEETPAAKKPETGSAENAAKTILDKLRHSKRK